MDPSRPSQMRVLAEAEAPLDEHGELKLDDELSVLATQLTADAQRLASLPAESRVERPGRWRRLAVRAASLAAAAALVLVLSQPPRPAVEDGGAAAATELQPESALIRKEEGGAVNSHETTGQAEPLAPPVGNGREDGAPGAAPYLFQLSGPELEGALDLMEKGDAAAEIAI